MSEVIRPTAERVQHGLVELASRPIKARRGEYAAPAIAVDLLVSMERRGAITADQRRAGERFRAWFRLAHFEGLRASDLSRTKVDGGISEIHQETERARREITKAIRWLGGLTSTQGHCLWHVIGLDESVREWARERKQKTSNLNAAGILAVTLESLAKMPWTSPGENRA